MGIAFGNDTDKNGTGVLPVQTTYPPCTPHRLKSGEDEIYTPAQVNLFN